MSVPDMGDGRLPIEYFGLQEHMEFMIPQYALKDASPPAVPRKITAAAKNSAEG